MLSLSPQDDSSPAPRPQRIAVIPGDGIGPEVARAAAGVVLAAAERFGARLELEWLPLGADHYLKTGETLTDEMFAHLRDDCDAIFFGAMGDARVPDMRHARDVLLGLRFRLDLYVNLRPVKLLHPALTPLKGRGAGDLDFVIFRENTEDVYVGMGGNFKRDTLDEVAINEMLHTRKGVERIIRAAFEWAVANGKRRVCMSDKANVLQFSHGLWQRVFKLVAAEYPQVESRHLYADVLAMEMVRAPQDFDVIVTTNMFGDILSDLGAELVGGLGLAASANLYPGRVSLFEPVHGSAPALAGKDVANPFGMILTGALMLNALGHPAAGAAVERAVVECLAAGEATADLGGPLGTQAAGEAVARRVRAER
ncbi:MAG: isocitrate/isopropylmalate dehydrogenase family protein [Deltaproteobacteria bacterium]|nr:isocitrate/isopropylmalate dehydrogenase family protein [Deltaproteobacteria bacterium]